MPVHVANGVRLESLAAQGLRRLSESTVDEYDDVDSQQ